MIGKYGPVVKRLMPDKTITFLPCKKDLDINTLAVIPNLKLEDVLERSSNDNTDNGSIGKYKGEDLFIKKGKYGLYAKWGSETRALKELGNRPIENIKYLEVLPRLMSERVSD